jgi:Flp pilus assembly protein TadD
LNHLVGRSIGPPFLSRPETDAGAPFLASGSASTARPTPRPDRRGDLANLAKAQLWAGRAADAAATYEKVLKDETAAPKQRAGWLAAEAAALMAAGDAQRAESRAREALALEPRQEMARRLLAELGDR